MNNEKREAYAQLARASLIVSGEIFILAKIIASAKIIILAESKILAKIILAGIHFFRRRIGDDATFFAERNGQLRVLQNRRN